MKPPVPIADNYSDIARRMAEIAAERRRPARLDLPDNVIIVNYGGERHSALAASSGAKYELCFVLRNRDLKMVKSRTGSFRTVDGFDVHDYLKELFPSASIVVLLDSAVIRFSEEDARKLAERVG